MDEKQKKILKKVISLLNEHHIAYQITGSIAAIFYGLKRSPFDIDIDIHKRDFPKTYKLFKRCVIEGPERTSGDDAFDLYLMTLNIEGVTVDISQAEEGYLIDRKGKRYRMDSSLQKAKIFDLEGMKVVVQDRDELITYKKKVGRDIDLEDIKQISH